MRIGVVGRPHGVRGLLKLHLDNRDSKTLRKGLVLRLVRAGVADVSDVVATVGPGIVSLEKVPDRTAAEALVGAEVFVSRTDFVDDEAEVFLIDAIGKDVVDDKGVVLGRIAAFSTNGAQPLAEVVTPAGKTVLVPFVPPIVQRIADVIELAPPAGLFDVDDE